MEIVLLRVASSVVAEVITWLNARLQGTVLKGDAAWIVAAVVALIAALVKIFVLDHTGAPRDLPTLLTDVATIWAVSQVFFLWVVQRFNLDVKSQ